jgi:tight adherence protein B
MATRVEALQHRREKQKKTVALGLLAAGTILGLFMTIGYLVGGGFRPNITLAIMPDLWLIYLLVFTAVLILSSVGLAVVLAPRTSLSEQLQAYENAMRRSQGLAESKVVEAGTLREKISNALTDWLGRKGLAPEFQLILEQAGLPLKVSEFVVLHLGFTLLLSFLTYPLFGDWLIVAVLAGGGAMVPAVLVNYLKKKRAEAFHNALPDTLSLIAGGLKAGYSFLQTIEMVSQETKPPMSTELNKVLTEARLGLPLEDALDNMAGRVQSTNFSWTVFAIKIQRETGGNLAEFLEVIAQTIRERDYLARQIKVMTAEGRLSAIILFLLPFVLAGLIYLVNRNYLAVLFSTTIGWVMVGVALVLIVMGGWWLKRIITIEV